MTNGYPNADGDAAGVGRVRCEFGIYSGDSSLIHALTTVRLVQRRARCYLVHMKGKSDVAIGKYLRSGPPRSRSAYLSEMRSDDVARAD